MFNERYGLQQAVIAKYKTMTRRIINGDYEDVKAYYAFGGWIFIAYTKDGDSVEVKPAYEVGETIAIAQAYQTFWRPTLPGIDWTAITDEVTHSEGWTNKMFVKAEYMPHAIRITGIKVERLQSISEADIMREGIHEGEFMNTRDKSYFDEWGDVPNHITFKTPRLAFQSLIDKVCKRGTWNRNPWVFAYEFELVR